MLKVLIIGLDGATFDIINPLIAQGRLPNLEQLVRNGASGYLASTIPPFSAPAWASFMTGMNPGKHGIFGFISYDLTKYTQLQERLVNSVPIARRTFWDVLGKLGKRVGVLTVPVTYPAWEVNGYMLSGYPCPDTKMNYAYPPDFAATLDANYNFSAEFHRHASEDQIIASGLEMLERRTTLALRLIEQGTLDFMMLVLGDLDQIQHDFWKYIDPRFKAYHTDKRLKYRDAIGEHYVEADRQIGRLLEKADEGTTVIVMSDHGAGPHAHKCFYTNAWLRDRRLLALRQGPTQATQSLGRWIRKSAKRIPYLQEIRQRLPIGFISSLRTLTLNVASIDWSRTRAYRFTMYPPAEGIVINLKGRQPEGIVAPGPEYEQLRQQLIQASCQITDPDSGSPVVQAAYCREELYSGPYVKDVPDIVFVFQPGYKGERNLDPPLIASTPEAELERPSGQHSPMGILIAYGRDIRKGIKVENAAIIDIAPTCLFMMEAPVPSNMDGRVLHEIFERVYPARERVESTVAESAAEPAEYPYTPDEEAQILEKLRQMGYA